MNKKILTYIGLLVSILVIFVIAIYPRNLGGRTAVSFQYGVFSSSSLQADTLLASTVCNNSLVSITPLHADLNVTLPATSTLFSACLNKNGSSLSFLYVNGGTATTTTIIAGTGINLATTSGAVIWPNGMATINCSRLNTHYADCLLIGGAK